MAVVKLGLSIKEHDALWRYMSIEKLISMFESKALFFSPLFGYLKSDPFEGLLPRVAFEAFADIFSFTYKELNVTYSELSTLAELSRQSGHINADADDLLAQLREGLDSKGDSVKKLYKSVAQSITVNCWHRNQHESDAMWRLYSENGKGIAIKTSVASLKKALEAADQNIYIQIGAVKYLDFNDPDLLPKDCVVDGHLAPLLKRASFSHENEVRLFNFSEIKHNSPESFVPKAKLVALNIEDLIEEIYISPFAGEPFVSSTIAICEKYGVDSNLIKISSLLDGHEELLDSISDWSELL